MCEKTKHIPSGGRRRANPLSPPLTPFVCCWPGSPRRHGPARPALVGAVHQQLVSGADAIEVSLEPQTELRWVELSMLLGGDCGECLPQGRAEATAAIAWVF